MKETHETDVASRMTMTILSRLRGTIDNMSVENCSVEDESRQARKEKKPFGELTVASFCVDLHPIHRSREMASSVYVETRSRQNVRCVGSVDV